MLLFLERASVQTNDEQGRFSQWLRQARRICLKIAVASAILYRYSYSSHLEWYLLCERGEKVDLLDQWGW